MRRLSGERQELSLSQGLSLHLEIELPSQKKTRLNHHFQK